MLDQHISPPDRRTKYFHWSTRANSRGEFTFKNVAAGDYYVWSQIVWETGACRTGGYAYALGRHLHGDGDERYYVKETRSIVAWTLGMVALIGATFAVVGPAALAVLAAYGIQTARVAQNRHRRGDRPAHALLYGVFCMLGKWAQLCGMARFWAGRLTAGGSHVFASAAQPRDGESATTGEGR